MLQNIRERFTGGFALAILALMCVPFLFFGIPTDFIGSTYAAKVNGEEVPLQAFDNAYQQQLARYAEQGGSVPEQLREVLRESVMNQLINEVLIDQFLSSSGFRIGDGMITDLIRQQSEFQVDGEFSKDTYYTWLSERGQTPASFERLQRASMRQSQVQRGVIGTAFITPADYRRFLNLAGQEREVSLARFDVEAVAETVEVGEEAIRDHYDEHPMQYRSEESVDFKYVELRRDELRRQVEITEEELRAYYEDSRDRYLQDEERQARHILIPFGGDETGAREQATSLVERARAGEPFADLARQYSADGGTSEEGGLLPMQPQSQYEPALGEAIFAMQSGDVRLVQSGFGFHVVRLEEIARGGPLPFAQVRPELERELRAAAADEAWREMEDRLSDALFDAESIDAMAAELELETKTANGFTRSGGAGFGANEALIDAVFDESVLNEGFVSDIVELEANRSVVVQVTEYREAARLPLEEVRERIVDTIRTERAEEIIAERSSELEAAVREGREFQAAAESVGATEVTGRTIGRQDQQTDAGVRAAIFELPKPEGGVPRVGSAQTSDGDYAVFQLVEVIPGRPESIPIEQRDEGKRNLASQAGNGDFSALVLELERQADIVRNQDALGERTRFE